MLYYHALGFILRTYVLPRMGMWRSSSQCLLRSKVRCVAAVQQAGWLTLHLLAQPTATCSRVLAKWVLTSRRGCCLIAKLPLLTW